MTWPWSSKRDQDNCRPLNYQNTRFWQKWISPTGVVAFQLFDSFRLCRRSCWHKEQGQLNRCVGASLHVFSGNRLNIDQTTPVKIVHDWTWAFWWQRQVEDPRDLFSGMCNRKQTARGSLPMFLLFQEPPASFKCPKQFKSSQTVIISCYSPKFQQETLNHWTFESVLPTHPNTWFHYMYPGSFSRFLGHGSKCCVYRASP